MEDVFNLREFLIKILRGWRILIVLALVCGLLGGGYKLYQGRGAFSSVQVEPFAITLSEEHHIMKSYVKSQILLENYNINHLRGLISALDQVDAEHSYAMKLNYFVDMDSDPVGSLQIADAYVLLLQDTRFYEWLAEKSGVGTPDDLKCIKELVWVMQGNQAYNPQAFNTQSSNSQASNSNPYNSCEYNSANGFFSVNIWGESEEFCLQVAVAVREYINKSYPLELTNKSYSLNIANSDEKPVPDASLLERKVDLQKQDQRSQALLTTLKGEAQVLESKESEGTPSRAYVLASVLIYAMLGCLVGFGLGMLLVFLLDVMDLRIKSSGEAEKELGLKCLAEFHS